MLVTAAILVIEIEEVLVAKIVSGAVKASRSLKILSLRSIFSVAASITRSTLETPVFRSVNVVILLKVLFLSSSVIVPLLT
ncbi:hypothetical protein D3C78_1310460 [compost metagenome]